MAQALRIVCQGERGACAHGAGKTMFADADVAPQPTNQHALEALLEGAADYALLPAYNTRTGGFPEALALLARSDLHVVAEVWRPIMLRVYVPKGWVKAQRRDYNELDENAKASARAGLLALISEVYSDQAGFAQYQGMLKRLTPRAQRRVVGCTGEAARLVHQGEHSVDKPEKIPNSAALCSDEAALMYDLVPLTGSGLANGITPENDNDNATLFYVVARKQRFSLPNEKRPWRGFAELLGQERMRRALKPGDLKNLFQDGELKQRLAARLAPLGLDPESDDEEVERERAKLLFQALAGDGEPRLRNLGRIAREWDAGDGLANRAAAAERAAEGVIHARDSWSGLAELREPSMSLRGASDVKSVLMLRAKPKDKEGQRLLRALLGEASGVNVRILAVLPPPANGEEGPAFIAETNGYLAGLNTDKGYGGFSFGRTPPEKLLGRLIREAKSVQVLGSFPRAVEPARLGLETPASSDDKHEMLDKMRARLIGLALAAAAIYAIGAHYHWWWDQARRLFASLN